MNICRSGGSCPKSFLFIEYGLVRLTVIQPLPVPDCRLLFPKGTGFSLGVSSVVFKSVWDSADAFRLGSADWPFAFPFKRRKTESKASVEK